MALNLPITICVPQNVCLPIVVEPPFGLPAFTFADPCCVGIDIITMQLNQLLAPMQPFLKLVDCVVKLIDIVLLIPDAIGPPPSILKVAELVDKLVSYVPCIEQIISMAPLPVNIVAFAKFIKGICQIIVALLTCLKKVITVFIEVVADTVVLGNSADTTLQEMGVCLAGHAAGLGTKLVGQLAGLAGLFNMVNALLGILLTGVPPLKTALEDAGLYPLTPTFSATTPPLDTTEVDAAISVLSAIEAACIALGG